MEKCLLEQLIGDVLYDGINGPEFWFKHLCLADVMIQIGEID